MKKYLSMVAFAIYLAATTPLSAVDFGKPYKLEVLPSQAKHLIDKETGVELLFLNSEFNSRNLYFHERSFSQDGSFIIFNGSDGYHNGMAFLTKTEELVYLKASDGNILSRMTAARHKPTIYGFAGTRIVELALEIKTVKGKTEVWARERFLLDGEKLHQGLLNESCDGRYLSVGGQDYATPEVANATAVFTIDTQNGALKRVCGMPEGMSPSGVSHIQWSISNPNLLSFANGPIRLWIVDIRNGKPWAPYVEHQREVVTHEKWWVDDQLVFCGSYHPKPQEDGHVKVINVHSGDVRVIGAGAWWPTATAEELAKRNWWHCSASDNGLWVVADNWHGDIMLWEGKTSRPRLLTQGHRTYGKGQHPEVGFDNWGTSVIFASHLLGNGPRVCVAKIPEQWIIENHQYGKRIESLKDAEGMSKQYPEGKQE